MKPIARTITPGYAGPRVCHRCGRRLKDYETLVSLNPSLGEWNPDLCGSCIRLLHDVYKAERRLRVLDWTLNPIPLFRRA